MKDFQEKYPELTEVSYAIRLYYGVHKGVCITDPFSMYTAFEHVFSCTECREAIEKQHSNPDAIKHCWRTAQL